MNFPRSAEWRESWRSGDCWRQTVPCRIAAATENARPPNDDLLVAGTTSAGELDDLRRRLAGLHLSDLLKLVGLQVSWCQTMSMMTFERWDTYTAYTKIWCWPWNSHGKFSVANSCSVCAKPWPAASMPSVWINCTNININVQLCMGIGLRPLCPHLTL